MKKRSSLTVTLHIGGQQVESLTEEQLDRMAQRLSETMSDYYSIHPDEYARIKP